MDATEVKAELIRLLVEDADVRAALLVAVGPGRLKADPSPEKERPGPGWLRKGDYLAR